MKSTNYYNTFIAVAEDCPAFLAVIPQLKGDNRTIALQQYELIAKNPYKYTQDDVLFMVYAERQGIDMDDTAAREAFFSKGQACLRASPLGKRYGWGVHCDGQGKLALYAVESADYSRLARDKKLKQTKAMQTKRL